jgi:hypothetical protein
MMMMMMIMMIIIIIIICRTNDYVRIFAFSYCGKNIFKLTDTHR